MTKAMGAMNLYREELKEMARGLDQEGLSQGAIAKELGVPHRTISDWLSVDGNNHREAEITSSPTIGENRLSIKNTVRYLVVCQAVEKFQPPDEKTRFVCKGMRAWVAKGN